MANAVFGTAMLAAFLGGAVALFAPCCISVMLPAYFASSFRRRVALTSMTLTFALGVSAVILPIAFGAAALSRLIAGQHGLVFGIGGGLMILLGVATLAGYRLPMPGLSRRASSGPRGAASVFALGAFSGAASACCAPVLAGVVGVSAASGSFLAALALGVAYVFGMVTPLFVIALLWDRCDWGETRLLRGGSLRIGWRTSSPRLALSTLLSGFLLVGMGALVMVIAATGPDMSSDGFTARLSAELQHLSHLIVTTVDRGPAWIASGLIVAALVAVIWKALHQSLELSGGQDTGATEPHGATHSTGPTWVRAGQGDPP